MGLTDRRKTAQNLDGSRKQGKKSYPKKTILLLRFNNCEERAKLPQNSCVSYFAATLTLYVPISASFAFHQDCMYSNKLLCLLLGMILFMAHKKVLLTGNSLTFCFYFKQRVHVILRERVKLWQRSSKPRTSQLGFDT